MKPTKLLLAITLGVTTLFTSCKKEESVQDSDAVVETTFEAAADNSTVEFFNEDDNDVLMEAAQDNNFLGNFVPVVIESNNFLACATVTVTPQTGFPKTILIKFDSTCTNPRGIVRKGAIRIVVSDFLRNPGATAVMTFERYFVNNFHREGTHTWTNTSNSTVKSWQRKVEGGKVTAPGGRYWLHESVKDVVQTAGVSTPLNFFDDAFSITGNASVTNANGARRTATIIEPLQKKYACRWIDKGRVKFQGPNHYAVLDYGNGICDNIAMISINGRTPRQITLP
jgi:hypothetical protein